MSDEDLLNHMDRAMHEALVLWKRKQADYGPNNIAQVGEVGVALRANDKVQRLRTLLAPRRYPNLPIDTGEVMNEGIRDSWLDLINYAAMGLLLRDGKWPQPELSDKPAQCPHCGKEL